MCAYVHLRVGCQLTSGCCPQVPLHLFYWDRVSHWSQRSTILVKLTGQHVRQNPQAPGWHHSWVPEFCVSVLKSPILLHQKLYLQCHLLSHLSDGDNIKTKGEIQSIKNSSHPIVEEMCGARSQKGIGRTMSMEPITQQVVRPSSKHRGLGTACPQTHNVEH